MGNAVFGKPRPQPQKPVVTVDEQLKSLEKRRTYLEALIRNEDEQVKNAMRDNNKQSAMRHLTLRKRHVADLQSVYGMIEKLETIRHAKEQVALQKDTILASQYAASYIDSNTMDVGKAEDIMDSVRDAIDKVDDVSRMFTPITNDADLEAEFEALSAEPKILPMPEPPMSTETKRPAVTAMERELALAM